MNKQMVPVFVDPYDKESLNLFKNDNLHWNGVQFVGEIDINNPDKRLVFIEYLENVANRPTDYSVKLRIKGMIDFPSRDKEFREFKKYSFFGDLFKEMPADELQKKLAEEWTPEIPPNYFFITLNNIFFCEGDSIFEEFGPNTELALKDKDTGLIVEIPIGNIENINKVTRCLWERRRNSPDDINNLGNNDAPDDIDDLDNNDNPDDTDDLNKKDNINNMDNLDNNDDPDDGVDKTTHSPDMKSLSSPNRYVLAKSPFDDEDPF